MSSRCVRYINKRNKITSKCYIFNVATSFDPRGSSSGLLYKIILFVLKEFYFSCYPKNMTTFRSASPVCRVARAPKFFTLAPNTGIYGSYVWNLLRVILMAPRILRWLLGFGKICASLATLI